MRSLYVVLFLYFSSFYVSSQSFITFKGDYIYTEGSLKLNQNIHANSFTENATLSTRNSEFGMNIGVLECADEGVSFYSATANVGIKHTRLLAQQLPNDYNLNIDLPKPSGGAPGIFSHYQIGDYLIVNNTGLNLNGEVVVYGFLLGGSIGAGFSKMKSGFSGNNVQNLSDAGWYADGSISFGYSLRFIKVFYQWDRSNFGFGSVKWSAPGKKEKDFSSLSGRNITNGVGFSIVVPIPN